MNKIYRFFILQSFLFSFFNLSFAQTELFHKIMPVESTNEQGKVELVYPKVQICAFDVAGNSIDLYKDVPLLSIKRNYDENGGQTRVVFQDAFGQNSESFCDKDAVEKVFVCEQENDESFESLFNSIEQEGTVKFLEKGDELLKTKKASVLFVRKGYSLPENAISLLVLISSIKTSKEMKFLFQNVKLVEEGNYVFILGFNYNSKQFFLELRKLENGKIENVVLRSNSLQT